MKKCMSGCGGKMSMQKGGALKPLGAKLGVGTNLAAMIGLGVKGISDTIKAKKEKKKVLTEKNKSTTNETKQRGGAKYQDGGVTKSNPSFYKDGSLKTLASESKKRLLENIKNGKSGLKLTDAENGRLRLKEDMKKKKYQKGGGVQKIVGMPGYNAKTNTMKSGGANKFGMLSVKAGIDKNPRPTAADRIAGAKKKKK